MRIMNIITMKPYYKIRIQPGSQNDRQAVSCYGHHLGDHRWIIFGDIPFAIRLPRIYFSMARRYSRAIGRPAEKLKPEFYYALVTMHGTILVFFVLTAGLSGTFANFLIPLQIGARDMASPFLNMLSYWFFFLASIIMFSSLFTQTGPASGGWTIYPPLSALHDASVVPNWYGPLALVSMAMFIVSSLLGGLNYITTILNMRTQGYEYDKAPANYLVIVLYRSIGRT